MAQTMHEIIKERCELAVTYAEDGAYASALRILKGITVQTEKHCNRVLKNEELVGQPKTER